MISKVSDYSAVLYTMVLQQRRVPQGIMRIRDKTVEINIQYHIKNMQYATTEMSGIP